MTEQTFRDTPYKGLVPYSEEDAPFFFGRETEQEIITANLMASRLTLLYGASGVGKSSVLRAGVAHNLQQLAQKNLSERGTPEFGVLVFNSWRDNPVELLELRLQEAMSPLVPRAITEQTFPVTVCANCLSFWKPGQNKLMATCSSSSISLKNTFSITHRRKAITHSPFSFLAPSIDPT